MPRTKDLIFSKLSCCLWAIKRRYPITQHQVSKKDLLFFYEIDCLSEKVNILRDILIKLEQEILDFKLSLHEETLGSDIKGSPQWVFNQLNQRLISIDETPYSLIKHASDFYYCLEKAYVLLKAKHIASKSDNYYIEYKLLRIVSDFEDLLGQLSDYIETYSSRSITSSAFSLSRYIENLKSQYDIKYKQNNFLIQRVSYLFNFQHVIRYPLINSVRMEEIQIISDINLHPLCDDNLRCAMMSVICMKIEEVETIVSSTKSELRKILSSGLEHIVVLQEHNANCALFNNFCLDNKIELPVQLSNYLKDSIYQHFNLYFER